MTPPPIIGIVGPTASGKTELALALARRLPLEILVADSRQVVRGMDIGTAKPDAAARAAVPHHLLDLVRPDAPFTVAEWVARAREAVVEVAKRGRLPALVGGTGLYVTALLDGHDYGAQAWSPDVREQIVLRLEAEGLDALADDLRRRDPTAAARTDLRNPRRVVRALERVLAGDPAPPAATPYAGRTLLVGIARPREELYRRIDERARRMFAEGLLDEVQALLAQGHGPDLPPMTGHGYREAARVLAGEWGVAEAVEVTARHTRQYAKRQLSWFRRDRRIVWLDAGRGPADATGFVDAAERVIRAGLA